MTAYRILAAVLTLACLAGAVGLFLHQEPLVGRAVSWLWQDEALQGFVASHSPRDLQLKVYLVYLLRMGAVMALGLAVLFAVSAVKPLLMRPFIVAVIVTLVVGIAMDIYCGITLEGLSPYWWAIDAAGGALLLVLLIVFFPKPPPAAGYVYPEDEEGYLEE